MKKEERDVRAFAFNINANKNTWVYQTTSWVDGKVKTQVRSGQGSKSENDYIPHEKLKSVRCNSQDQKAKRDKSKGIVGDRREI